MAIEQRIGEKLAAAQLSVRNNESTASEEHSLDLVPGFMITVDEAKNRVALLQVFVSTMMVPGQDYGTIPGSKKPSLFKPGAEKLCDIFGFSKIVTILSRVEDWDKPFLHYEVKVTLINKKTGITEAEGIGSCNSREKKYLHQDTFSLANTLLKMAKKRALVDAVLSATRSSGLFTQDVEDLDLRTPAVPANRHLPKVTSASPQASSIKPARPATDAQLRKILALAGELNLTRDELQALILQRYRAENSRQLSLADASDLIQHLIDQSK